MSRYIDADALDNRIKAEWAKQEDEKGYGLAHFFVETQPTADVAPVIHAQWIRKIKELTPGFLEKCLVCSECDAEYDLTLMRVCCTDVSIFPICPCCGAKMDEEAGK